MPRLPSLRHTLLSSRDLLMTAGPFVLLTVALLALAYWALDPSPPKKLVLATGPEQGAYAEFGKRYQAALARHRIQVELRTTQGAAENLKLLEDPDSGVDFGFVQGGAGRLRGGDEAPPPDLVSLGSLFIRHRELAAAVEPGSQESFGNNLWLQTLGALTARQIAQSSQRRCVDVAADAGCVWCEQ